MSPSPKISSQLLKFSDILNAKYHGRKIKIRCIVSGITNPPYKVPKDIAITRKDTSGANNTVSYQVTAESGQLLSFIDVDDNKKYALIKTILKLGVKKGESVGIKIIKTQNIERIFISAPTGEERTQNGSSIPAYYLGLGIEANTKYELEGYAVSDPKTQQSTAIFLSAKKLKSDADSFDMTEEIYRDLCIFNPKHNTPEGIKDQLNGIYTFYGRNITDIVGRYDLHLAIDLAFKSPLTFKFNQEIVHKGWADVMIIGDSRTGKSEVAERLVKYFAMGEIVSGENISHAGLVGGLEILGKYWNVRWGRLPLNDKELIVIDEASSLRDDDWSRLSSIRANGIAEITKIHREVTNARTRIIFLCNPINRTTASFSYGIQALQDVVKAPEDIARFDYVVVVAKSEVTAEEINRPRTKMTEIFSRELDQLLNRWVWSRTIDQISFSDKAEAYILEASIRLSKMYSSQISLIQGENVRVKLAKLSTQIAGRMFSNKNKGKVLFADIQHAVVAEDILHHTFYEKEVNGYYHLSQVQLNNEKKVVDNNFAKVNTIIEAYSNKAEILNYLISNNTISCDDMDEYMNLSRGGSREIISPLLQMGCLFKKGRVYIKTPEFTMYVKRKVFGIGGNKK